MSRAPLSVLLLICLAAMPAIIQAATGGTPYLELKPAFVVNVGESGIRVSFAKVDVTLRLQDEVDKERVMRHQPGLRDILVSALTGQPLVNVESGDDREALRVEALENLQAYLEQEEGATLVSDLLFTSFVVQR